MLDALLRLPAFVAVVWAMYFSLPLAVLCCCIKSFKLWGPRNDMWQWCNFLVRLLGIKVRKLGTTELYRDGPCMYLSNHRSWADFFIDAYLTEGRGQLMSRLAVLYVFPAFMIPVIMVRGCICFKRGSIANKEKFNAWITQCVADSPVPGICLFPEGHRSRKPTSLPLKRGMLHYAYNTKMPVQVVMTAHKEAAVDESRQHARLGATCVTAFSEVIASSSFNSAADFFDAVQAAWDEQWLQVFSADPEGLPMLQQQVPGWPYPLVLRLSQLFWTLVEGAVAAWLLARTWRVWAAAAAWLCGAAGLPAASLLVVLPLPLVWLLASLVYCYDPRLPRPALARDGTVLAPHGSDGSRLKAA